MVDFREITEFLRDAWGYIVTFIVLAIIFLFVVAIVPVSGNSMNPTLCDGNISLVLRFAYKISDIKRNDIVTLTMDDKKSYVKRVIGLPGEEVSYLNGYLIIDGEKYKETYIKDGVTTNNFLFEDVCSKEDCPDGVIPEDMYLVLGDNRSESTDSRSFGLVNKKDINGKVIFKLYPFSKL